MVGCSTPGAIHAFPGPAVERADRQDQHAGSPQYARSRPWASVDKVPADVAAVDNT